MRDLILTSAASLAPEVYTTRSLCEHRSRDSGQRTASVRYVRPGLPMVCILATLPWRSSEWRAVAEPCKNLHFSDVVGRCDVKMIAAYGTPLSKLVATARKGVRSMKQIRKILPSDAPGRGRRANVHACDEVLGPIRGRGTPPQKCENYMKYELLPKPCTRSDAPRVPHIYHATGPGCYPSYLIRSNSLANPSYRLHYANDSSVEDYILKRCGADAHKALRCIRPPAYRADLFRFCALLSEGGVYLDGDLALLHPLHETYSPCASATIGYDWAEGGVPGKQMKIVAGLPRAPLFQCMVTRIVQHVRERKPFPAGTLAFSGPQLLQRCYESIPHDGVAITYRDTREAVWPWTGMRNATHLYAYEAAASDAALSSKHYSAKEFSTGLYSPECDLN